MFGIATGKSQTADHLFKRGALLYKHGAYLCKRGAYLCKRGGYLCKRGGYLYKSADREAECANDIG